MPPIVEPPARDTARDDAATAGCDTSTMCLNCGEPMQPEHAHYRCRQCGWRDSCCDGPY